MKAIHPDLLQLRHDLYLGDHKAATEIVEIFGEIVKDDKVNDNAFRKAAKLIIELELLNSKS